MILNVLVHIVHMGPGYAIQVTKKKISTRKGAVALTGFRIGTEGCRWAVAMILYSILHHIFANVDICAYFGHAATPAAHQQIIGE